VATSALSQGAENIDNGENNKIRTEVAEISFLISQAGITV
jgi:hypothetical protein